MYRHIARFFHGIWQVSVKKTQRLAVKEVAGFMSGQAGSLFQSKDEPEGSEG
jgi:hypothetical protein